MRGETMTFGAKLKALRQEHELTQYQLAKKLDTSKSNISKYESDSIEPSMRTLVLIAKYFNVSIDYLLGNSQYSKIHLALHPLFKHSPFLLLFYLFLSFFFNIDIIQFI